ncbi:MAG: asparagine synthase C-terminal domain-containing protein, partial [Bacteroidales bacterium]
IFIQSGPTQQGYSMFSDTLYDRGRELGVTLLLSGFGGDEGVTSKAGGFFEEMAALGRWDLYKREYITHAGGSGFTTMKRAARYYLKRYLPFAESFIMGFRNKADWRAEKYPGLGFTREFEERMGIEQRFYERLGFPDDPEVRARQYKRIMHDHVSQRLEYSYLDAKAWGIEYAYPLWDIDLVEFYYSLPQEYKYRNGMGRAIYRDAMQGILPEKIRLRNDKTGATVPTVQQRFLADYDAITALIRRSREHNRYHYLDYDKMLAWQVRIKNRGFNDKQPANPAAFFNSLQLLLLQEMEREGVFNV